MNIVRSSVVKFMNESGISGSVPLDRLDETINKIEKFVAEQILDSMHDSAIRQAAEDISIKAAILDRDNNTIEFLKYLAGADIGNSFFRKRVNDLLAVWHKYPTDID